jgi:hypothetical protein
MKLPSNPFGVQNPNSLSIWLRKINEPGTAQHLNRRKRQGSQRSKSLVEMVEELKKRHKK